MHAYTCMHAYTQTSTHTHTHKQKRKQTHITHRIAIANSHIHTYIHAYVHTYVQDGKSDRAPSVDLSHRDLKQIPVEACLLLSPLVRVLKLCKNSLTFLPRQLDRCVYIYICACIHMDTYVCKFSFWPHGSWKCVHVCV